MSKKIEKTLKENVLFEGIVIKLHVDDIICPNGNKAVREFVSHNGGAAIVAIENDEIFLVKQYRYAYKEEIYEIPAGKLEKGEDPINAAYREIEEEIGYKAKKLILLGKIYPTPGYTNEIINIYLAEGLIKSHQHLDPDEFLNVIKIPLSKFKKMILDGEIKDAKTVAAYLYYQEYIKK